MRKLLCNTIFLLSGLIAKAQLTTIVDPNRIIQENLPKRGHFIWDRGSSFAQQSTLYNAIDFSSYELLSANLSFTDKDQTQKIVASPFKLSNNPAKLGFLINTKINLALKDKITTIGFAIGGDNSTYYSKRGIRIRQKVFPRGVIPLPGIPNGSISESQQYQIEVVRRTSGNNAADSLEHLINQENLQKTFENYNKELTAGAYKALDSLLLIYDKAVAMHVFRWSLGYNIQLFPNLFSSGSVNGFDSLNYYTRKAHVISFSVTYSYDNNKLVLTAGYNQLYARTSAVKEQKTVPYYGPSLIGSIRLIKLVKQSSLDTAASYKKSLFVPSINLGLSFEAKYADRAIKYHPFYQDNLTKTTVWTPFVDLLISPALQFRIGIPITRSVYPNDEKQISAGANIQYNFKLPNLSQ